MKDVRVRTPLIRAHKERVRVRLTRVVQTLEVSAEHNKRRENSSIGRSTQKDGGFGKVSAVHRQLKFYVCQCKHAIRAIVQLAFLKHLQMVEEHK